MPNTLCPCRMLGSLGAGLWSTVLHAVWISEKHIFPSFSLFFFSLFWKQMTNFILFLIWDSAILEPNHKCAGEIKRPCKGFVKQHVSWGDLAELYKALQLQKGTIVNTVLLLVHRNWSKTETQGAWREITKPHCWHWDTLPPPQSHCPPLLHQHCWKAQLPVTS